MNDFKSINSVSADSALLTSKILHLQILKEILDLPLIILFSLSWLAKPGRSSHFSLRHSASLLPHAAATCGDGSQVGASPAICPKEAYIYFTVNSKSSERDMETLTPEWAEYELLDSGEGKKLERFGEYVLVRPEPQARWAAALPAARWQAADGAYVEAGNGQRGGVVPSLCRGDAEDVSAYSWQAQERAPGVAIAE